MKKLISIGVALALLTMAVVPGAVAAYDEPATYSKVPFAILASGFELLESLWPDIDDALDMGFPWLEGVFGELSEWTAGPLSWTVDMLAWGVALTGDVMAAAQPIVDGMGVDLPFDLGDAAGLFDTVACGLLTCWSSSNCTGNFTPCD